MGPRPDGGKRQGSLLYTLMKNKKSSASLSSSTPAAPRASAQVKTADPAGNIFLTTVTREQIAERAYELWDAAGRPEGRDVEYWLTAEKQLGVRSTSVENRDTSAPATAREVSSDEFPDKLQENLDQVASTGTRSPTSI